MRVWIHRAPATPHASDAGPLHSQLLSSRVFLGHGKCALRIVPRGSWWHEAQANISDALGFSVCPRIHWPADGGSIESRERAGA